MPKKYNVIDELIKDELREFLLWLNKEKQIELCKEEFWSENVSDGYCPIHKAPEDLINEYMEAE